MCISLQASGGRPADHDFFWYPSNVQQFGERLVYIAGLATAALYVHYRTATPNEFPPDPVFEKDHLQTMLFGRGYFRGTACAIIQRAGDIRTGPFKIVVKDDRPVTRFAAASAERPGDRLRGMLWDPIEEDFARLLHQLNFLNRFEFGKESGDVRFQKTRINPLPFLSWDGMILRLFRQFFVEDRQLAFIDYQAPETVTREPASGELLTRLSELAKLFSFPDRTLDVHPTTGDEGPTSIIHYFADTYPLLPEFARMLWRSAEDHTKMQLWLRLKYGDDTAAARGVLDSEDKGESVGTAEIVKHCLEHDPIAALEEFFTNEPGDVRQYIDKLVEDRGEARRIFSALEETVEKHVRTLRAFFPSREDDDYIRAEENRYRARVSAVRVAGLIGFPIVEFSPELDLQSHIDRARGLAHYLRSGAIVWKDVDAGLLACSKATERILRFLCLFYRAIPYFRAKTVEGISNGDRATVTALREDMRQRKLGLGKLIGEFREVGKDKRISDALGGILERHSVWPKGTETAPFAALNMLNDFRLPAVHDVPSVAGDPMQLAVRVVEGYQQFLDWLDDPERSPKTFGTGSTRPSGFRIYPWVVNLNLVTTTRSGVTSLKYMLHERHEAGKTRRQEITVYTSQPLSVANCYYGLPHPGKIGSSLWVDPLLLQADIFSYKKPGLG